MFDFFRRKKNEKNVLAIEIAINMLQLQIQAAYHIDDLEFDNKLSDYYCRGYIFGFCDAYLQVCKLRDDDNLSMKLLQTAHSRIYGEIKSPTILTQSLKDQNNDVFLNGLKRGGQDCNESFKFDVPPNALLYYLVNGKEI